MKPVKNVTVCQTDLTIVIVPERQESRVASFVIHQFLRLETKLSKLPNRSAHSLGQFQA